MILFLFTTQFQPQNDAQLQRKQFLGNASWTTPPSIPVKSAVAGADGVPQSQQQHPSTLLMSMAADIVVGDPEKALDSIQVFSLIKYR